MKKDCFNSIDELPIWNWWKIAETGNLIYLHRLEDYDNKKDYSLMVLWNKIQDEYLEEFGITPDFRKVLSLKKKWITAKTNFLITEDRFLLNEIEEIEIDIDDTMNNKIMVDKDDTIITLERKLNRELDPKKITVKKYYKYINHFSKNA